jgi:hypothetical protein
MRISSDLPCSLGDAGALNLQLQKMTRNVEDIVSFAIQQKKGDPVAFLKEVFKPDFDTTSLATVFSGPCP